MSAGGARRGRRDNGLDASEYAVAGDVDPRVGEHLLDVLAAGGIAAYLQPSSDVNPVTRTTTVPARPVDRLFVDRLHLDTARGYLVQLAEDSPTVPGKRAGNGSAEAPDSDSGLPASRGPVPDTDAVWAGIIASYHAPALADPTAAPWPAAEDLPAVDPGRDGTGDAAIRAGQPDPGAATADEPDGKIAGRDSTDRSAGPEPTSPGANPPDPLPWAVGFTNISVGRRGDEPSLLEGLDTFGSQLPDEPEEGYTPPPPPPLPQISPAAVLGVLAIIAGFILFVFPTVLPVDRGLAILLGFAGVVGGFVTLIWRLRPDHDEDEGQDDGAVV
ncbi:DUF308 domain-containing protein [Micromonospora sp. NBC_01813]|uniref:DUF308 domain-containing protein n=1 Tax=Micromonospora sp. NBC_01813 TaxID=2975988 RepID=UPI002DDAD0F2|nr:DUF308 domain-containing protein [Micromonospora sp. NBC_01813]WSA09588.1 DUF308 domain-containing protein [Micromonospora sp. NBC_01813]